MKKLPKLVTLDEANSVWGNANFGDKGFDKLAYIKQALDKESMGYKNGWTITQILIELKLLTPKRRYMSTRGYYNLINL